MDRGFYHLLDLFQQFRVGTGVAIGVVVQANRSTAMNVQNPQEAFFTWLGQALARAINAVRGSDSQLTY